MTKEPDLTEFYELSTAKGRKRICPIGVILPQLDAEAQEQLRAALATDQGLISNAAIDNWLKPRAKDWKALGQWQIVRVHREGRCSCAR